MFTAQSRIRKREQDVSVWRQVLYGVGIIALVVLLITGVHYITRIEGLTLSAVVISGTETIAQDHVRGEVERILDGDYFRLIPHRFAFLYPEDDIVQMITSIDRVRDVTVTRDGKTVLNVTVTEYEPFALWCKDDESHECYFLDTTGYAFTSGPRLTGGALIRHTIEGVTDLSKKQVLEADDITRTHVFLDRLTTELSLRVTDVLYTKNGDVRLSVNGGGMIEFSRATPLDTVFENLNAVLSSKEFDHLEPGNFQYIDLRFGNKIFVNEEPPTLPTVPTTTATSSGEGE